MKRVDSLFLRLSLGYSASHWEWEGHLWLLFSVRSRCSRPFCKLPPSHLLPVGLRVIKRLAAGRLRGHLLAYRLTSTEQYEFLPKTSFVPSLLLTREHWASAKTLRHFTDVMFGDFSKSFDNVHVAGCSRSLGHLVLFGAMVHLIKDFFTEIFLLGLIIYFPALPVHERRSARFSAWTVALSCLLQRFTISSFSRFMLTVCHFCVSLRLRWSLHFCLQWTNGLNFCHIKKAGSVALVLNDKFSCVITAIDLLEPYVVLYHSKVQAQGSRFSPVTPCSELW